MNPALRAGGLANTRIGRMFAKQSAAEAGMNVGWSGWATGGKRTAAASRSKLTTLLGTYGGTDNAVVWVGSATALIMSEMASYPYEIVTPDERIIPKNRIPADLRELLDQPNEDMTYFDMVEYRSMDMELAGNSYWLKDQMNAGRKPLTLQRLRPELVQIAVNDAGRIIGYVYFVEGVSTPIPYDRDEIIHFKLPNPLNEYYGMGTVERLQRTLNAELSIQDHVTGFFVEGGRISGVLTTSTMSEVQFQRFKDQFYEEFLNNPDSLGILVAENGTRFDPITQTPASSGVVELKKMNKDEILGAFGVPSPLLGGVLDDANHKIEDSEHVFSRKMVPRARRESERMTRDLVAAWSVVFRINFTYAESRDTKIKHASEMLKGGATINESRAAMDQPPVTEEWANTPVIPQGFAPFGFMTSGGAPSATPVSEGGRVNGQQPAAADKPELAASNGTRGIRALVDQRNAVLENLRRFADAHNAKRTGKMAKETLSIDNVWPGNELLVDIEGIDPSAVRDRTEEVISEGMRRKYSVQQIGSGVRDEMFDGILWTFDKMMDELVASEDVRPSP